MSIYDYIRKKTTQFQAKREAIATATHEDKQEALLKLREQRKKLEARAETNKGLLEERKKIRELKQEAFKSSPGGALAIKVFGNMQKKIREGKAKGNLFTQSTEPNPIYGGGGPNPFTQGIGKNPFLPEEKKKKDTIVT